jgi:hypothetical protein
VQQSSCYLGLHSLCVGPHIDLADAPHVAGQASHSGTGAAIQVPAAHIPDAAHPQDIRKDAPMHEVYEIGWHWHKLRMVGKARGQDLLGHFAPT